MKLKEIIKKELISKGIKLRNKYPPISEKRGSKLIIQKVKKIYQLKNNYKNFYLIITKVKKNQKSIRFYLAIIIANQSSDFLVKIAKKVIQGDQTFRIIQFSFHPKQLRINLAILKELDKSVNLDHLKEKLKNLKSRFLSRLNSFIQ